jgi:hypothetical protein
MINFPVTATLAFLLVILLQQTQPEMGSLGIAGVSSACTLGFGLWFFPFSQSLWLWVEHRFHPLNDEDRV